MLSKLTEPTEVDESRMKTTSVLGPHSVGWEGDKELRQVVLGCSDVWMGWK